MINSVPINSTPINTYAPRASSFSLVFSDSVTASTVLGLTEGVLFLESLGLTASVATGGTFVLAMLEALDASTEFQVSLTVVVSEPIIFADSGTFNINRVLAFLEQLQLRGTVGTIHDGLLIFAESLAITAETDVQFGLSLAEALNISDAYITSPRYILTALEGLLFGATSIFTARLFFAPNEALTITADLDPTARLLLYLQEGLDFGGVINTPDGVYEAWVLNTETKAAWQYTNFPFNSFAFAGSKYLALTDTALYELEGSTDDGTNIDSIIKTGLIDFGSKQQKSIPRAYFGYTAENDILFKTITTRDGQKHEDWYKLEARTADDSTLTRVQVGRGLRSVYWQFEISNISGSDFELDTIKLTPAILKRRV